MQIAKELLTRIWTSIFFTTSFSDFTQGASCIKKTGGVLPHYLLVLFVFCKTDGAQNKTRKWVVVVVVVAAPVLLNQRVSPPPHHQTGFCFRWCFC